MTYQEQFRNEFLLRTLNWKWTAESHAAILADLALAQANHESGGFLSHLCQTANNAIGYKVYPGSIWQKAFGLVRSPEGDNYAQYADFGDCAGELADWIHRRKERFAGVESVDDYAQAMKDAGWYGDTFANYSSGMRRWFVSSGQENDLSDAEPDTVDQVVGYITTSPDILYAAAAIAFFVILRLLGIGKKLRL